MPEETVVDVTPENVEEVATKEYLAEKGKEESKIVPEPTSTPKEGEKTPEKPTDEENKGKKEGAEAEKGKEEEKAKSDEDIMSAEDDTLNDTEKTRKKELTDTKVAKDKEDEEILNTEDSELDDEKKTRKQELLAQKGQEGQEQEKKNKAFEEEVKAYSEDNNVSLEEAKEELESVGKIIEKYHDDDPKKAIKKLAKASLELRRLQTETAEKLKTVETAKPPVQPQKVNLENVMKGIEAGEITFSGGKQISKEKLIAAYREQNNLSDEVNDETVFKLVAKEVMVNIEQQERSAYSELADKAKDKRAKLLRELPEDEKKFIPDIELILSRLPDTHIMREGYNLKDLVQHAMGGTYKKDIREARDEAFKRGQQSIKIKTGPKPGDGTPAPKKGFKSLSASEQTEAWEQFPQAKNDEECFEMYNDVKEFRQKLADKKKKNAEKKK